MCNCKNKPYLQPAFLICALLLFAACLGKKAVIEYTGVILTKIPVELKKSFDEMDRGQLAPYIIIEEMKITNKEILESLGTDDYIQWVLEDMEVSVNSPTRYCSLFITYYGMPDRVPHVPEECYIGSGSVQEDSKAVTLTLESSPESIDIKLLDFKTHNTGVYASESKFSRMYFFRVNDDYVNGRTAVRNVLSMNLFGRHSFFSKIEWEFLGPGKSRANPSDEQIVKASEKLLSKILPVLGNEHWPVIKEIVSEEKNIEANTNNDLVVK